MTTEAAINAGRYPELKTFPYVDVATILISDASEDTKRAAIAELGVTVWPKDADTVWTEHPEYEPHPDTVVYEADHEDVWAQFLSLCVSEGVVTSTIKLILGPFITSATPYEWGYERKLQPNEMMHVMTTDTVNLLTAVQKLAISRSFIEYDLNTKDTDNFRKEGKEAAQAAAAEWVVENKINAL